MTLIECKPFKNEEKTEIVAIIGLSDRRDWVLYDVKYREYRKRDFKYLESVLFSKYQHTGMTYEEKRKLIDKEKVEFLGEDKCMEMFKEAWEIIKPEPYEIVKEIME